MCPYFLDPARKDDEDPNQLQISGASPTTDSQGGVSQNSQRNGLNTGSNFENIDKYVAANSGKQFGQEVVGKVQKQVDTAKQNMADASTQFTNQVNQAGTVPTSSQVNSAIANPTSTKPEDFQNWENQTYKGPNNLTDNQDAWNKYWSGASQAQTSSKLLGSEPGRFTLLDSYYGKPSYNFGQKSLDNALIQHEGVGKQAKNLQNQSAQLQGAGKAGETQLQGLAATAAGNVDASRKATRAAIGLDDSNNVITGEGAGAIGKQYSNVDSDLAAKNAQRQAEYDSLFSDLQGGQLSDSELAQTGLRNGQKTYGVDLSKYATQGAALNRNQTMTPEQRSRIQALSQLAGITDNYASGAVEDGNINPYSFNTEQFNQAVSGAKGAYEAELAPVNDQISFETNKLNESQRKLADLRTMIADKRRDMGNADGGFTMYDEDGAKEEDYLTAIAQAQTELANQQRLAQQIGQKHHINRAVGQGIGKVSKDSSYRQ